MKKHVCLKLVTACAATLIAAGTAYAGAFVFYEGNDGLDRELGQVDDRAGQAYNLKRQRILPNERARSVKLRDVRPGARLLVYDHPGGRPDKDDWTEITVKKRVDAYVVKSFESSYEDDVVKVSYRKVDGLDGQISHVAVR